MKKSLFLFMMIGLLSLSGSCMFDNPEYQRELMENLTDKYEAEQINMKIHNKELIVTLVNSPLKKLSPEKKQEIAREIGSLAVTPEKRPGLVSGKLIFEENTDIGLANISDSESFDMKLKE